MESKEEDFSKLLHLYEDEGIDLCLWPLLPDELGYWASEQNTKEFSLYVDEIYKWIDKEDAHLPWIAVDLEPPIYQVEKLVPFWKKFPNLPSLLPNLNERRFEKAVKAYKQILQEIHDQSSKALAAVYPWIIDDGMSSDFIQDLLETPTFQPEWDRISFMIYSSLIQGHSQGLISREESSYLLYDWLKDAREMLGKRTAVSVGITGVGKLGLKWYYDAERFVNALFRIAILENFLL